MKEISPPKKGMIRDENKTFEMGPVYYIFPQNIFYPVKGKEYIIVANWTLDGGLGSIWSPVKSEKEEYL